MKRGWGCRRSLNRVGSAIFKDYTLLSKIEMACLEIASVYRASSHIQPPVTRIPENLKLTGNLLKLRQPKAHFQAVLDTSDNYTRDSHEFALLICLLKS